MDDHSTPSEHCGMEWLARAGWCAIVALGLVPALLLIVEALS